MSALDGIGVAFKVHVAAHPRKTKAGVTNVRAHDDKRPAARARNRKYQPPTPEQLHDYFQKIADTSLIDSLASAYGHKYKDAFGRDQTVGTGRYDIDFNFRELAFAIENADKYGVVVSPKARREWDRWLRLRERERNPQSRKDRDAFYSAVGDAVMRKVGGR